MESKVNVSCPDFVSKISLGLKQFWRQHDFPDVTLVESERHLDFSDVTLVTEDGLMVRAHQIVLVTTSDLFRGILAKSRHPDPIIFLTNIDHKVLKQLLRLVYQGECQMEREEIASIEKMATTLGFNLLSLQLDSCTKDSVSSPENTFQRVQIPDLHLDNAVGEKSATANNAEGNPDFKRPKCEEVNSSSKTSELLVDEPFLAPLHDDNGDQLVSSTVFHNPDDLFAPVGLDLSPLANCNDGDQRILVKETDHQSSLKPQQVNEEQGSAGVACKQCGKKYNVLRSLDLHIESVHKKRRFPCDECDHTSTQMGSLKIHKEATHLLVRYYCDQCEYQTAAKGNLKDHKRFKHDNIVFSCDQCQYKGGSRNKLNQHMSSRHQGEKIGCPMCELSVCKNYLRKHIRSIHEGFTHQCPQCDFTASFQQSITVHKQRVHEKRTYQCTECDYKCALKTSLKRHNESVHQNIKYLCEECSFKTTRKSILVNHQKLHLGTEAKQTHTIQV